MPLFAPEGKRHGKIYWMQLNKVGTNCHTGMAFSLLFERLFSGVLLQCAATPAWVGEGEGGNVLSGSEKEKK